MEKTLTVHPLGFQLAPSRTSQAELSSPIGLDCGVAFLEAQSIPQALHQTQNGYSKADLVHAAGAAYIEIHTQTHSHKGMVSNGTYYSNPHSFVPGFGHNRSFFRSNRQWSGQHGREQFAVSPSSGAARAKRCGTGRTWHRTRKHRSRGICRRILDVSQQRRFRDTFSLKENGPEFSKNSARRWMV